MDRRPGEAASYRCGSGADPAGNAALRHRQPVHRDGTGTCRHTSIANIRRYGRFEKLGRCRDAAQGRAVSGTACLMSAPKQHWIVSVAAVILAMMAIQMSSLGFSPLLPAIRRELAASYSQMGLFTGMYGLIAIFISLPAGILAARFGEKRMLLSGLAVTAAGLVCLGLSHSYSVALTSRAVWLVGYRFAFICVFTAMAVGTPEKYRSRTMGVLGALAALASVIGAPFGTRLAEWVGWRGGIFGFAA